MGDTKILTAKQYKNEPRIHMNTFFASVMLVSFILIPPLIAPSGQEKVFYFFDNGIILRKNFSVNRFWTVRFSEKTGNFL
jgi:hypothetical protein